MPDRPTSSGSARGPALRADTRRTRARIADAARRLLDQSAATPAADIAAAAGVSRSTASRAMGGSGYVSPDTRERAELQTLRAKRVVGLLVSSYGGYEDIGVPTVFFDDVVQGAGVGGVAMDNAEGIRLLVEHLATTHGHERIAYIGPPETNEEGVAPRVFVGRERLEAFRTAVGDAGLPLPTRFVRTTDSRGFLEGAREATRDLLQLDPRPTAIVAGSDTFAMGALEMTRERGVRVPDDLALVSFDEPPYAHLLDPPITSLDRHDAELGRRAAELLLAALAADRDGAAAAGGAHTVRVPLELRIRRSCGCPPQAS